MITVGHRPGGYSALDLADDHVAAALHLLRSRRSGPLAPDELAAVASDLERAAGILRALPGVPGDTGGR